MNPTIDVRALEEMLKFLIKKFGEPEGEPGDMGTSEDLGLEENDSEGNLTGDTIDEIDDDYIKPENREVRIPKHKRPKKMAFSLSELSMSAPKGQMPLIEEEEEEKPRFNKKGRR